jgi:hypothetical protein
MLTPRAVQVLRALVMSFVLPQTVDNHRLRQCLTYFFPIYCYSSSANQRRMMEVRLCRVGPDRPWRALTPAQNFMPIFKTFVHYHRELEDGDEMITPAQFTAMFLDWTDPQRGMCVCPFRPAVARSCYPSDLAPMSAAKSRAARATTTSTSTLRARS